MDLLQNSKCKNVWNQVMEKWTAVKMILCKAQMVAMKMGMVLMNMFMLKMDKMEKMEMIEKMEKIEIVKNNQNSYRRYSIPIKISFFVFIKRINLNLGVFYEM